MGGHCRRRRARVSSTWPLAAGALWTAGVALRAAAPCPLPHPSQRLARVRMGVQRLLAFVEEKRLAWLLAFSKASTGRTWLRRCSEWKAEAAAAAAAEVATAHA